MGPRKDLFVAISRAERVALPAAGVAPAALPVPALALAPALLLPPLLHASSSGNAIPPATAAAAPRRKVARLMPKARPRSESSEREGSELVIKFTSVRLNAKHSRKCS